VCRRRMRGRIHTLAHVIKLLAGEDSSLRIHVNARARSSFASPFLPSLALLCAGSAPWWWLGFLDCPVGRF